MSSQGKWKLFGAAIIAVAILGSVVGWQQFAPKPIIMSVSTATTRTERTDEVREKYLAVLTSLKDQEFAAYAWTHNLCREDNRLTELEVQFLNNSEQYGRNLLNSYVEEAERSATYGELGKELRRIPEVKAALNKTSVTITESVEDIVYSVLQSQDPVIATNVDLMLNQGIREARKYCTPLQALLWDYVDKEPGGQNPLALATFSPKTFARTVWEYSSVSHNFTSDQWKSFDDVVDRLNSRDMISAYMVLQLPWGYSESAAHGYWWKYPEETFKDKCGHCYDLSAFALHCLGKNGYTNAKILFVRCGELNKDSSGNGHAVCMQEEGTRYYTIDNGAIRGPFSTLDEVIMSASSRTKTGRPLAYRFFYYGSIPYHTPYGEIYYGTIGTYTIPTTLEPRKPPFDDPEDDLFDKDYDSIRAEPYLDIVSVNIWKSGTDTLIELTLKGPVPQRIDSTIFIQWSIYIDIDCSPNTGERSSLLYNDLGVDYNIRLTMLDSTFYSQIRTMPERKDMGKPRYNIKDNKITFIVGPKELQLPATPIFMIVTAQKWSNRGQLPDTSMLAADKAPNFGHYAISAID